MPLARRRTRMLRVACLSWAAPRNWSASTRGSTPSTGQLRLATLRGRVVLLEFWTFACVNCQRALPFLRRMHGRYQPEFTVVGVHTPEFAFEASVENVERAVRARRARISRRSR